MYLDRKLVKLVCANNELIKELREYREENERLHNLIKYQEQEHQDLLEGANVLQEKIKSMKDAQAKLDDAEQKLVQAEQMFRQAECIRKRVERKMNSSSSTPTAPLSSPSSINTRTVHNNSQLHHFKPTTLQGQFMQRWEPEYTCYQSNKEFNEDDIQQCFNSLSSILENNQPITVLCMLELLVPSSFWEFVSHVIRRCLNNLNCSVLEDPSIAHSWHRLWCDHVPSVLTTVLSMSMSPSSLMKDESSLAAEKLCFNRKISVLGIMMYNLNNKCSHVFQQAVSMAFNCSTTRLRDIVYKLGVCVTHQTTLNNETNNKNTGDRVYKRILNFAVEKNMPLFCVFDNADFNKRLQQAIHCIHYLIWIGRSPKGECPTTRVKLRDLRWTDVATKTECEVDSANREQSIRLQLATTIKNSGLFNKYIPIIFVFIICFLSNNFHIFPVLI